MMQTGFEAIALELQQAEVQTAQAQLAAVKELAATLSNIGIQATRIADALEHIAGVETKHTFSEEF